MKDLLRHLDGETAAAERQTLTADLVSQDDQGILTLIKVFSCIFNCFTKY